MSHSYSHLYDIPTTGLRFYRVWLEGGPGMILFIFTKRFATPNLKHSMIEDIIAQKL